MIITKEPLILEDLCLFHKVRIHCRLLNKHDRNGSVHYSASAVASSAGRSIGRLANIVHRGNSPNPVQTSNTSQSALTHQCRPIPAATFLFGSQPDRTFSRLGIT